MVAILKRELSSYFNSAVAYVVMAVYFLFSGLFFSMICIENDTSAYRPGAPYIAYKPF